MEDSNNSIKHTAVYNNLAALAVILEKAADQSLTHQKRTQEEQEVLQLARNNILPSCSQLAHNLADDEKSIEALYALISSVVIIVDPVANKTGITQALLTASNSRAGKFNGIAARGRAWRRWQKQAISIAKDAWQKKPTRSNVEVANLILKKFEGDGLAGMDSIIKLLSKWRPILNPRQNKS